MYESQIGIKSNYNKYCTMLFLPVSFLGMQKDGPDLHRLGMELQHTSVGSVHVSLVRKNDINHPISSRLNGDAQMIG